MSAQSRSATTLFLAHSRAQILDIVMRNLSEPHRFLLLAELSECRLRVAMRKYWAAFADPFTRTTHHFFMAGAETVECMRQFARRHGYTRFKLPAPVTPARAELWRKPERSLGLQRALPEIIDFMRPYWEELYEKRTPWTRRDFCLLRIAQITGALKLDEPFLRGLRIIFELTVKPIAERKQPRPTWDELLRPDLSKLLRPIPVYRRPVFDPMSMILSAIELDAEWRQMEAEAEEAAAEEPEEDEEEEEEEEDGAWEPPAAKRLKFVEACN